MPIGSILGRAVRRTEDPRFLTGTARYTEDVEAHGALHAVFVRSMLASAGILGVATAEASGLPGVEAVFTAADLDLAPLPAAERLNAAFARPLLARDAMRYVGEPVAVVLADTPMHAADAAEAILVDYDPAPVAADPIRAMRPDAPLLFPQAGSNVARDTRFRTKGMRGGALDGAEVVVRGRFVNQRVAPVPMEPNGALAVPDGEGVTLWVPSQAPFFVRDDVCSALGLDPGRVRVIAPAVGGGFGAKGETYPEQIVIVALALRLGRPVRYTETRAENMTSMVHGRGQVQEVELGLMADGRIVGLRADVIQDLGAYPVGTYLPGLTRQMASGVYAIPRIEFRARSVVNHTTPVSAYRGAGRPEATAMLERVMDMAAAELGVDPAEIRRRNFIAPDAFPYRTASGVTYDSGRYAEALDLALSTAGYEGLRHEQRRRREAGETGLLGIGLSTYVEITGWGSEFGSVEVRADGSAIVLTGLSPHGQGHETSLAQIASGILGLPMDAITVVHSDTGLVPRGAGTMGSRSLQLGGSAVHGASQAVLEKARRVAAHLLETAPEDVELVERPGGDGAARLGVVGAPDRSVSWQEVARAASDPGRLPEGMEPGLSGQSDFEPGRNTFPFGAHVAVVEVDVETGFVRLVRHVAVDDCGRIVNPMLVEGQVQGGVAQGAAQALFEEVLFDDDGNPLTGSLMTYGMPSAPDLPDFERAYTETLTPVNPLGAKGIGEAGTVGSTPAVQNAVVDALSHLGVRHIDMPCTPERVWRALREADAPSRTERSSPDG
jgi:carbon-monoxide dehydrogenase large subunit